MNKKITIKTEQKIIPIWDDDDKCEMKEYTEFSIEGHEVKFICPVFGEYYNDIYTLEVFLMGIFKDLITKWSRKVNEKNKSDSIVKT